MCCLPSRRWHSHRLLAFKLSSLLLPAFPLPAKCTMTPPPPCPFPFLFSSSDSLFLCTVFCICCCQLAPPLSTSPDHKQTTPQRSSLWVSLAVSSAAHHALLPFAAIPIAVPPPLPAGFRLHLQPSWLLHRRGQRAHHRCRCFKRQNVFTRARQVRHVAAE